MVAWGVMIQHFGHARWVMAALLCCLASTPAMAAGDATATAIRELATNSDFRVRTQAALSLGASDDAKAVEPLCRALEDTKSAVRAAAAAALGKLAKGGKECLVQREATEATEAVKVAVRKAIVALTQADGGSPECVIDASTRFYVSIGKTTDNTGRQKSRVPELVRFALTKAVARNQGFCIGPEGESKSAYQKRVAGKKKIRGLLLAPRIQAPEYESDAVTVRFEIAIFTFPEKVLKGMIPVKLTQQGAIKKSEKGEDELIRMVVERAVEKLLKNIERLD